MTNRRRTGRSMNNQPIDVGDSVALNYQLDWHGAPWLCPPDALLIHGLGESHVAWQEWVGFLGRRVRLVRPDLPGHGRSSITPEHSCTPKEIAEQLIGLLDRLLIENVHLV